GPVSTCDGDWTGLQNGYQLSFSLAQSGTAVTGTARLAGAFGFADGTVSGTCAVPVVDFIVSMDTFEPFSYRATMSTSQATMVGKLSGSGFNSLELNVNKR